MNAEYIVRILYFVLNCQQTAGLESVIYFVTEDVTIVTIESF